MSPNAAGFYNAGIFCEKASGARADCAELLRLIVNLQPGQLVVVEKIDRISHLPLVLALSIGLTASSIDIMGSVDASKGGAAGSLEATRYKLSIGLGFTLFCGCPHETWLDTLCWLKSKLLHLRTSQHLYQMLAQGTTR